MDPFELPDESERIKTNLEDDVRLFLLSRTPWGRMHPKQREQLEGMGGDSKHLRRPSYISVCSGVDGTRDDGSPRGCRLGAEGVMVHEDEQVIHLAFKCGNPEHQIHYTEFDPSTVGEMAKAMEAVWKGSIAGGLVRDAIKRGQIDPEQIEITRRMLLQNEPFEADEEIKEIDDALEEDDDEDDIFL